MGKFAKSIIFLSILNLVFLAIFIVPVTAGEIIARMQGVVSPGTTTSSKFLIDKSRTVHIRGSGVDIPKGEAPFTLILIDPKGTRIDPFVVPTHPSINIHVKQGAFKGEGNFRTLEIIDPVVGYWTAEIALPKNVTDTQRYHLEVSCEGSDITLYQEPMNLSEFSAPGKPAMIKAKLLKNSKPYLDSQASLTLRLESKPKMANQTPEEFSLQLYDDGLRGDEAASDGIYSVIFIPDEEGEYLFRINAVSPGKFERLAWRSIYVSAKGAHFTGNIREEPIDNDHNGKYEALKLTVEIEISAEGEGFVEARLYDKTGVTIGEERITSVDPVQSVIPPSVHVHLPATIGVHEISLIFPGEQFLKTKLDGPYFAQVQITNPQLFAWLSLTELKAPYQTKPYRWQDFE